MIKIIVNFHKIKLFVFLVLIIIYLLQKILILVNYDVDAICAVKILQCILRFDNIVYVLVPVKTITEFKKAFEEQKVDVSIFNYLYL